MGAEDVQVNLKSRIDRLEEVVKPKQEDIGSRLRKALQEEDDFHRSLQGLDEDEKAKRIKEREEERMKELDEIVRSLRHTGKAESP